MIFFKEKIQKLVAGIEKNPKIDPFCKLRQKMQGSNIIFNLKTVSEKHILKILRSLKPKKSFGLDGISAEIVKLGAEVLAVPLTYIVNSSIKQGKYPTKWKEAKVNPLHNKTKGTLVHEREWGKGYPLARNLVSHHTLAFPCSCKHHIFLCDAK